MQAAEYEVKGQVLVIRLKADLDHHTALSVRESADSLLARSHAKHLLFDFTGVDFMDSSGIGVIMGRYRKIIQRGGDMVAVNTNRRIEKILLLSGIQKLITIKSVRKEGE